MKNIYKIGDHKVYKRIVSESDVAEFEAGIVHPFYGTFALGRDAEWAGRLFVLDMLEEHEEGIGTFLTINHVSPALVGQHVEITAEIVLLEGNRIDCAYVAKVGDRVIANGTTGQRILTKEKVQQIEDRAK